MKIRIAVLITMAAAAWTCRAGIATPATNGFAAVSGTFYVNTNQTWWNPGSTEHPGVDIAANGNILVGWENDGNGITDFEAVWTLLGPTGAQLTTPTLQTNRDVSGNGACGTEYQSTTNPWLSFFRDDNTAIGGYTGWGGGWAKGNRFGNGLSWGAMCWEIGLEISELAALNTAINGDDTSTVQLLNNDGTPLRPGPINGMTNLGILTFTIADATPAGQIRCGESEWLSSGNIAIVGESRQTDDWALTGQTSGNVPVYRVWTPGGLEVHTYAAVSSEAIGGSIYRGMGVTANGFAIRWGQDGVGSTIRLFNNAGVPTSADINLATLSGHPEVAGGGDGSGAGFHGNAVDAYVYVNSSGGTPWVTVINADGTLRWSRKVQDDSDPIDNSVSGDVDGAIDASGRVIVVFSSPALTNGDNVVTSLVQARMFDKAGNPLGPKFVVSETESNPAGAPLFTAYDTETPRVAWRGNNVAIIWLSKNAPTAGDPPNFVLAARVLAAPITITSVSHSGTSTTINWTGGKANYSLRRKSPLTGAWSTVQTGITGNSTTYTDSDTKAFYQVFCPQ